MRASRVLMGEFQTRSSGWILSNIAHSGRGTRVGHAVSTVTRANACTNFDGHTGPDKLAYTYRMEPSAPAVGRFWSGSISGSRLVGCSHARESTRAGSFMICPRLPQGKCFQHTQPAQPPERQDNQRERERQQQEDEDELVKEPTRSQLITHGIRRAVPFVIFGFLDNTFMLLFGSAIESSWGRTLGISTMASAALGNMASDGFGIGLGQSVESFIARKGWDQTRLTDAQQRLKSALRAQTLGAVCGVTFGCLLGMWPLLLQQGDREPKDD